jgi:N6-adenosine-specific RNA methylase IME4
VSPMNRYRTIVADPPWPYEGMTEPWRSSSRPDYGLMSLGEIKAIPVRDMAEDAAHLYCWAVLPMMAEAFDVVREWGFRPCTVLTWCKDGPGLGAGFRGNTEHLIVARRGTPPNINPTCAICGGRDRGARTCRCEAPAWRHKGLPVPPVEPPFNGTADGTWYVAPRREHSAKPDLFADLVERMSPGPYVELFARRARFGWDYWGDQSLGTAEMGGAAA